MLSVNSYIELFSLPFGWQQYNQLWGVLTSTGIVYLPFAKVLLKNASQLFVSSQPGTGSSIAIKKTILEILMMIFTITIAVQPTIRFDTSVATFNTYDLDGRKTQNVLANTTFRHGHNLPREVKVPLLYYGFMSVSYGISHALSSQLGPVLNLRQVHAELNSSFIKDSKLKSEVTDFYNQCWKPSYTKYLKKKPELDGLGERYGIDDPDWLGSHFFQDTRGYYDSYYSYKPIKNFTASAIDDNFEDEWARPNCKDWWSMRQYGLGARLSKELPRSYLDKVFSMFAEDRLKLNEKGIRRLLEVSFPQGIDLQGDSHASGRHHISKLITSKIGMLKHSFGAYPKMHIAVSALPIIQALVLVGIVVVLPIYAVLVNFKLEKIIIVASMVSSIIFWKFLWELVNKLDDMLIRTFYPNSHMTVGGTHSLGEYIVDLVSGAMYVVFPAIMLMLMTSAGFSAGAGIAGFVSQGIGTLAAAGDKGGSIATNVVSAGTRLIK